MRKLLLLAFTAVIVVALQPPAPKVKQIRSLPPDDIPRGTCKFSTAGWLGVGTRTDLTDAELGEYVHAAIRDGYVLTIYPPTKRGVYVNADCNSATR